MICSYRLHDIYIYIYIYTKWLLHVNSTFQYTFSTSLTHKKHILTAGVLNHVERCQKCLKLKKQKKQWRLEFWYAQIFRTWPITISPTMSELCKCSTSTGVLKVEMYTVRESTLGNGHSCNVHSSLMLMVFQPLSSEQIWLQDRTVSGGNKTDSNLVTRPYSLGWKQNRQ